MSDLKEKFVSVKEYPSAKEYIEERILEEVIEIRKFTKDEAFRMEEKGFFFMPNKITYFRKAAGDECEILGALSRNKRKKMKKAIRNSSDFEFVYENPLTEKTYLDWYDKVYVPNIGLKKHGRIIAARDWQKKSNESSRKIGVFFKKKGDVVSGIVAKSIQENSVLPKRMSISYSSGTEDVMHLGLMDCLNVKMIIFAKECGYDYIFRGKDTNLYGKHLGSGIPVFKTSLGYEIMPLKSEADMLIKFNDLSGFEDTIFFVSYTKNSEKLIGNLIFKKEPENVEEYKKPFLSMLRVFRYTNRKLKLLEEIRTSG